MFLPLSPLGLQPLPKLHVLLPPQQFHHFPIHPVKEKKGIQNAGTKENSITYINNYNFMEKMRGGEGG